MEFIELTKPSGKKVFVNAAHITFIEIGEGDDKYWTYIATDSGATWVRETIEQVLEKLNRS